MSGRAHLALLAFAWSSLARRRGKAIALAGGLALAVALIAAVLFATSSLRAEAERARATQPDLVVEHIVGGRPGLFDPTTAAFVAKLPGVRRVRGRVWGYVFFAPLQSNVTLVGRAPDDATNLADVRGAIARGRDAKAGERGVAVVGSELSRLLQIDAGNLLGLPSPRDDAPALRVVGVFDSPVSLYTSDVVLADERDVRAILDVPDGVATDLAIDLSNPDEASVVAKKITDALPGARVLDKRLLARTYLLTYGRRSGVLLAAAIPALLAMLVLAWDRASGLGPAERREIAIQKAVGWSTADVLYAKLYESVLVGACATAAGIALGYLWVFPLGAPGLREVLAGWSVLYPSANLTPAIDAADVLGLALGILAPFVALGIVPAWRAAILDPMEALRT